MRKSFSLLMAVILVAAGLMTAAPAVVSADEPTYMCFPSCSEVDGRFLILAGTGLSTLSGDTIYIELSSPADAESIEIGIYDGDTGGTWDLDNDTGPEVDVIEFELYADPKADGSGAESLGVWTGTLMPDKSWYMISMPNDTRAQAPSGHYFYGLHVRTAKLGYDVWSAFKMRTDGTVMMSPQAFAFMVPMSSVREASIIYPHFAESRNLTEPTYDGSWDIYMNLFTSASELIFWDGDFDKGSTGGSDLDTDDFDTPNDVLPSWATGTEAVTEGIAKVTSCRTEGSATGCPADDRASTTYRRSPSVRYDLITPDSQSFADENPSGNSEWEQFRISTDDFDPATMDYHADDPLPPGSYHVRAEGVDLSNLNAWRFNHWVTSVPVDPPQPYLIGDYVWLDSDREGDQDEVNAGIAGVLVNLVDSLGVIITSTLTDADGLYTFEVPAGTFTVVVDVSNFDAGQPLANRLSTTGGESQTNTVVDANILTYDFGYAPGIPSGDIGSLGDYIWLDANGDGEQDADEAGLAEVRVELWWDIDGDGLVDEFYGETYTDADGYYLFDNLSPAYYEARVDATTLPADLQPSYDLDGIDTPHQALREVGPGESAWDVDFGYAPPLGSLGDYVWFDTNGDGVQDADEPGLSGVSVILWVDSDSDGVMDLEGPTQTTDANGFYLFTNLSAGAYEVRVDNATLPLGVMPTYDLDGVATPHVAQAALAVGETRTDVDFGYNGSGALGDCVWFDADSDGCICDTRECDECVCVDPCEAGAGLGDVRLTLAGDTNNDGLADFALETWTDAEGKYQFTGLPKGAYQVTVDANTLPDGITPFYDLDGIVTPHTARATLNMGASRWDVDFGYSGLGSIGDTVWRDSDADGAYEPDAGELPISDVTVRLFGDLDGDGINEVDGTATTNSLGLYLFDGLAAGSYTVRIDATNFSRRAPLYSYLQTYDYDLALDHTTTYDLMPAENWLEADFGYRPKCASGTGTPGYWKTHSSSWPVQTITIGNKTYTKSQAISWLGTSDAQDKTVTMFRALVAAKLNVGVGNQYSCVADTIAAADAWMAQYGPVGKKVKASSAAWRAGEPLATTLDRYNNGQLCAPHRD